MPKKGFFKTTPKSNSADIPRRARRLFRREEGQSALEFVLVLPVFILAFLLLVDLGMLMYQYVSLANAVREGARFGAINCGDGSCTGEEVKSRLIARSGGILVESAEHQGEIKVDWMDNDFNDTHSSRGDSVVVRVNHPYDFLFFPGSVPVGSCADMSLEQSDQTAGLPQTTNGC